MDPLKWGSRGAVGIGAMWGGVSYGRGEVKATHMGILAKKMCVPPLWLVGRGVMAHVGDVNLGLFNLKSWCVLQDLVPDVWELIFAQVPV